jgi:hypothetical protein
MVCCSNQMSIGQLLADARAKVCLFSFLGKLHIGPKPKGPRPVGTTPIVAWHEVPGKASLEKPSRRVRYDRARLIPDLFLVEMCAVFLKEGSTEIIQHKFFKFCISKFRHSNHRIGSLIRSPARIIPYPTGRLFWMAPSQALRARLRSHRPSGTFRNGLGAKISQRDLL